MLAFASNPLTLLGLSAPGPMELLIVLAIVLVLFGPKALPQLGKALGSAMREFKGAANKFNQELDADVARDAQQSAPPVTPKPAPAGTAPAASPGDHS